MICFLTLRYAAPFWGMFKEVEAQVQETDCLHQDLAVLPFRLLLEGRHSTAIGLVNDQITYTSFDEAINSKKDVNRDLLRLAEILAI